MVTLYTTHCPKCHVLETKLNAKNIEHKDIDNVKEMESLGFMSMPMLDVDGNIMDFMTAINWVNAQ